ncbi:hypothetical protein LOD99_14047 [Oopsacas minuta]|uniref:Hint domain-containing protein n=1 Tax=Oopsacas minuta TaxID=111878 RepID=A0AAV7KGP6_9METZ|nr:hypothetical protein LOD99_14047 [Oopsacas minuta]
MHTAIQRESDREITKRRAGYFTASTNNANNSIIGEDDTFATSYPPKDSYLHLPATLSDARLLAFRGVSHPAMNMVGNSLRAHRASNEAIIFLYGVTGSGKSSTLNHLFNRDLLSTSDTQSCTKDVAEYAVNMTSDDCKIHNLEIGFIDVPGWSDTDGSIQDAVNLNTISKFTRQHPHLSSSYLSIYPNIVLIVVSAVEKRLGGEYSNCAYMLRAVSKLGIVDRVRPNVVFVLTHAGAIPKGRYRETKVTKNNEIQELCRKYLSVPSRVVWIENDIEGNLLDKAGEWTYLTDKEKQPINLFEAMISLMKENGDDIGREAVRMYFSGKLPKHMNPEVKLKVSGRRIAKDSVNIGREIELNDHELNWYKMLMKELQLLVSTEITQKLREYTELNKGVIRFQEMTPLLFYLQEAQFTKLAELQARTLQEIENELKPFLLNKTDKIILLEVFKVQHSSFQEIARVIGCGYNKQTKTISSTNMFDINSLDCDINHNIGIYIPRGIELIPLQSTEISCGEASCMELTTGINDKVYAFDIIHKVCVFVKNKDFAKIKHSKEFLKSIKELPNNAIYTKDQVDVAYTDFLRKYGHWEIEGAIESGRFSGNLTINSISNQHVGEQQVRAMIVHKISMIKDDDKLEENPFEDDIDLNTVPLIFAGGDQGHYCPNFKELTHEKWNKWVQSIFKNPIFDPDDFTLSPISNIVEKIDKTKGEELQKACNMLYSNNKIAQSLKNEYRHSISVIRNRDSIGRLDTSIVDLDEVWTRLDAADKVLQTQKNSCFPGNACVVLKGGNRVRMDELKIGDYVLSIHPTTYKPVYSKVYLWAHRDTHITATFLHITHPHGHLHISANHLILTGDNKRPVPAHQLRVGDTIHFLSPPSSSSPSHQQEDEEGKQKERGNSHTLMSVPVLHIDTCTHKGYYAPFTMNSYIVVDGIAASVFSLPEASLKEFTSLQQIGHNLFLPMRLLEQIGMGATADKYFNGDAKIHRYAQFLQDSYQVLKSMKISFIHSFII